MKPQVVNIIYTFADLKAALESLSKEELKQPVRVLDRHNNSESFDLYAMAEDDVGPFLVS